MPFLLLNRSLLPKEREDHMNIITIELLELIKEQYRLKWFGIHGVIHWHRVYMNGIRLASQEEVNTRVLQLFSVFHDSRRKNEHRDKNHGKRGAELARELRKYCPLDDAEFNLLTIACSLHTNTQDHDNMTVQACFDSDRLDLGRVGHYPDPDKLCTPMAKDLKVIEWAYHRSLNDKELPERPFGLSKFD
jgi:uncharacterized protein